MNSLTDASDELTSKVPVVTGTPITTTSLQIQPEPIVATASADPVSSLSVLPTDLSYKDLGRDATSVLRSGKIPQQQEQQYPTNYPAIDPSRLDDEEQIPRQPVPRNKKQRAFIAGITACVAILILGITVWIVQRESSDRTDRGGILVPLYVYPLVDHSGTCIRPTMSRLPRRRQPL